MGRTFVMSQFAIFIYETTFFFVFRASSNPLDLFLTIFPEPYNTLFIKILYILIDNETFDISFIQKYETPISIPHFLGTAMTPGKSQL